MDNSPKTMDTFTMQAHHQYCPHDMCLYTCPLMNEDNRCAIQDVLKYEHKTNIRKYDANAF